jgi:hypothetical protein
MKGPAEMGWWKVQGSEDLVGDDAFRTMREAANEVVSLYRRDFDRAPTPSEWQRLIGEALEPIEDLESPRTQSMFNDRLRPREVQITVEPLDEETGPR